MQMTEDSIYLATAKEAAQLAELYAKQFRSTGFTKFADTVKRKELVGWVKQLCIENKIWVIRDSVGPIVLGHYEPDLKEIKTVVTRDDKERQGYGTRMLCFLASAEPLATVIPVTTPFKALARKCGFSPKDMNEPVWIRSTTTGR